MNIFDEIKQLLILIAKQSFEINSENLTSVNVEIPKNTSYGDISTNIAMVIAPHLRKSPRDIATTLIEQINKENFIKNTEVAGAGFINLTLKPEYWHRLLKQILVLGHNYGISNIGNNEKVIVEYVSANPTGPLHVGHARGAIYGDALASLLTKTGYNVTKEYYINDAGKQIEKLAESLYNRYLELYGHPYDLEKNAYPGEYLIDIAKSIKDQYGDKYISSSRDEWVSIFSNFAIENNMEIIKTDLLALSIFHDHFTSEKKLHEAGKIINALEKLRAKDMIYEGELEAPKGIDTTHWKNCKLLLFKSTSYGDDQDRALTKEDGSWTYFAADAAYTLDKIERGFKKHILIVGADHIGYQKRILALTDSLSNGTSEFVFRACQLVNFIKDGQPFKMSKRAGTFVTVGDVIKIVGKDVLRFIMLTRKNDVPLDFDFNKLISQSKENPVFYVQYAHARINSVFNMVKEVCYEGWKIFINNEYDLSLLLLKDEIDLIKKLSLWPKVILGAATSNEPHRIAFYIEEVASEFHSLWNKGRENKELKFIVQDNPPLTASRIALIKALQSVIANGLTIIGVTPVEQM
jgi:arginyl-tRNA synthetase